MKSPFHTSVYVRNADIYKILAHPIRLEILNILKTGESSVEDLRRILKIRKANISQHLTILRHTRTVTVRHEGRNKYYNIVDPRIVEPCRILKDLWK